MERARGCCRRAAAWLAAALLAGCGGGSTDPDADGREQPLLRSLGSEPIPADASTKGMWGPVVDWPLIGLHEVLLPDGRVLSYGTTGSGKQTGYFVYDVWDPALGTGPDSHLTLPNHTATDLFCAAQLVLPAGDKVFLAGGDNWTGSATNNLGNPDTNLFDPRDNSLTRGPQMSRPRWYATLTTLPDGQTYIQGGKGGDDLAEVRGLDGSLRPLPGLNLYGIGWNYPRNFVAPDGRIFGFDTFGNMYHADPRGTGSLTRAGYFNATRGEDSSAVMFRPGRILQFGGSSNAALVIDIRGGAPVVTPTQSMSTQRRWVTGTLLPDGRVLATGGSRVYNELTDVNNKAEIWDPVTGTWTLGHEAAKARLYHSIALLLPDGTVLVGAGGAPGPLVNTNAEIYHPPYLFTAAGTPAARPSIGAAPAVADVGATIRIGVESARPIARVTLVKTGSITHSFNNEQRFLELSFASRPGELALQMPTSAYDAPPGLYLLFAIDDAGVPSVAKVVRLAIAPDPKPAVAPTLQQPADQSVAAGTAVELQLVASDPNGDALAFAAAGLPPGLSLDAASGRIAGTPLVEGSHGVVVTVSDGINAASRNFTWTVAGSVPLEVSLAPGSASPSSLGGASANFSATASGSGLQFQWNFGDGSPDTPWSLSASASHVFAQPGAYQVSVTVRDAYGRLGRHGFLQSVSLPPTAGRPTASSSIAFDERGGARRLWVVNQDNHSVSVFDESSGARLAEVATGAMPRHVAIAANGRAWITNKQSATITLIDAATLAPLGSIALPRASQPHGLAMSPDGRTAFVALEATGQVLRFDTVTLARTGAVAVGPNPRHLALRADGSELLVSRFITPPQPGESSAGSGSSISITGGEVVVVGTATMAVARTIVLAHGAQPDTERSGRGVPNYLGAPALSPDGTQAWVPSKQDNIRRGLLRDGQPLNFQNTVRAIASRIDLAALAEDRAARIDLDNAALASAARFDPRGVFLFVALESSREIAVLDAHRRVELFRVDSGRAPQGLALSADGLTLYVDNAMDRTVGAYDLRPLLQSGQPALPLQSQRPTVAVEKLPAQVLLGKQLFHDARDPRLARDRYLSCASCHNEAGHDGRVWDLSSAGEGLRRTIALRGKGRQKGHGFLHWSGNFDEVQDFEGQIRNLAGGTGLMADALFEATAQPLGAPKAGKSADLDALAAYLASLATYDLSPHYPVGTPAADWVAGQALFRSLNCAACHGGEAFSSSGQATLHDIGTLKAGSGTRLGAPLTGIDPPTLRGVWALTSYLHDGSAPTLQAAVRAHRGVVIGDADLALLVTYLKSIGHEEVAAPVQPGSGKGLLGSYFVGLDFGAGPAYARTETIDFTWGAASPGAPLGTDGWSVRWTGFIQAPATGTHTFQLIGDDGVRLTVDGRTLIDRLNVGSGNVTTTTAGVPLVAGAFYSIVVEHQDRAGDSTLKLRWTPPGSPTYFVPVPAERLYVARP